MPGEDPLACAKRELKEETGYTAGHYEKMVTLATTVGFSNELIHIYAATELSPGKQSPDEDEFIHAVTMPLAEAIEGISRGVIIDSKTITAVLLLDRQKRAREGGI